MKEQFFRLYRVILPVTDIETAVAFYSGVLKNEGMRVSPGRHYFNLGGTILACYDPRSDGDPGDDDWKFHENQYLYIATNDLTKTLESISAFGGEVTSEIEQMPWGETLFYAKDPFNNPICFVEESSIFLGE